MGLKNQAVGRMKNDLINTAYNKAEINVDRYNNKSTSPHKMFKRNHKTISYSLSTGK